MSQWIDAAIVRSTELFVMTKKKQHSNNSVLALDSPCGFGPKHLVGNENPLNGLLLPHKAAVPPPAEVPLTVEFPKTVLTSMHFPHLIFKHMARGRLLAALTMIPGHFRRLFM